MPAKEVKIAEGKLLKIEAYATDEVVKTVKISGDFFAHPEEAVDRLQDALMGARVDEVDDIIRKSLDGVRLYGVAEEDIISCLREVLG